MFTSRNRRPTLRRRTSVVERLERRELLSAEPWEIAARIGQRLSELADPSFRGEQHSRLLMSVIADGDSVTVQAKASGDVGTLKAEIGRAHV